MLVPLSCCSLHWPTSDHVHTGRGDVHRRPVVAEEHDVHRATFREQRRMIDTTEAAWDAVEVGDCRHADDLRKRDRHEGPSIREVCGTADKHDAGGVAAQDRAVQGIIGARPRSRGSPSSMLATSMSLFGFRSVFRATTWSRPHRTRASEEVARVSRTSCDRREQWPQRPRPDADAVEWRSRDPGRVGFRARDRRCGRLSLSSSQVLAAAMSSVRRGRADRGGSPCR